MNENYQNESSSGVVENPQGGMQMTTIPKLDGNNYLSWREMIEISLELQGLDMALKCETTDKRITLQARLQLLRSMDEEHRKRVRGCQSAKEILRRLEMIYADKSAANAHRLLVQYYRYTKKPEDSMSTHIGRMSEMRLQLADIEEKQSDRVFHCTIIGSLPSEYSSILEIWESTPDGMQTTENLIARLLRKEQDIKREESNQALVVKTGVGNNRKTPDEIAEKKKNTFCGKCKQKGHWWRECPNSKPNAMLATENIDSKTESEINFNVTEIGSDLKDKWVSDSGASSHMSNKLSWFADYTRYSEPRYCSVGDGKKLKIEGIGRVKIEAWVGGNSKIAYLNGVLYIPDLATNLFSIGAAAEKGIKTTFDQNSCKMEKDGEVVAEGFRLMDKLYLMRMKSTDQKGEALLVRHANSLQDYHRILGHANIESVKKLLGRLQIKTEGAEGHGCIDCPAGKAIHASHPSVGMRAEKPGVLHVDLSGKINKESLRGYHYYMLCKDEFTDLVLVYFCREKNSVPSLMAKLVIDFENLSGKPITEVHTDNGSEFVNRNTELLFLKEKIKHCTSAAYCPQQNGRIEREMRTITETARTLLHSSKLPTDLWAEAVATAVYLRNRLPNSKSDKPPLERLTGQEPYIGHLVEFGTPAYAIVNDKYLTKWDARTEEGHIVGFTRRRNTFLVYIPARKRVIESCDIVIRARQPNCGDQRGRDRGLQQGTEKPEQSIDVVVEAPRGHKERTPWVDHTNNISSSPAEQCVSQQNSFAETSGDNLTREHVENEPELSRRGEEFSRDNNCPTLQSCGGGSPRNDCIPTTKVGVPLRTGRALDEFFASYLGDDAGESLYEEISPYYSNVANSSRPTVPPPPVPQINSSDKSLDARDTTEEVVVQGHMSGSDENCLGGQEVQRALFVESADLDNIPKTLEQAMSADDSESWKTAIQEELAAHKANGTWEVTPRSAARRPLSTKWVFTIKRDSAGRVEKYKARLVARGFEQRAGLDFQQTFAPVARLESIRTVLAVCAAERLKRLQFDISTAFLNGLLEEEVWIEAPGGLDVGEDNCLKLVKALYGLKQAPRAWNSTFDSAVKALGFTPTTSDPCIYTRSEKRMLLIVYVDDCIICGRELEDCQQIVDSLAKKFALKTLKGDYFLGIEINESSGICLSQQRYIHDVASRFQLSDAKGVSSPMVETKSLTDCEAEEDANAPYREAIGCLMYIACCTRPDILFAVNFLSRFNEKPKTVHWTATKRIIRYLLHTSDYALCYEQGLIQPQAFSDADWANDADTRRSTSGVLITIAGGPVIFASRKQGTVALSSTEAEYIAASESVKEIKWLTQFLLEIQVEVNPITLFIDNQSTIRQIENPDTKRRSKHIDIRYHFVREEYHNSLFKLAYIETTKQKADLLTKPLSGPQITELSDLRRTQDTKPMARGLFASAYLAMMLLSLVCITPTTANSPKGIHTPLEITDEVIYVSTDYLPSTGITRYRIKLDTPDPCIMTHAMNWASTYDVQQLSYRAFGEFCQAAYKEVLQEVKKFEVSLPGNRRYKRVVPLLIGGGTILVAAGIKWGYEKWHPNSNTNRLEYLINQDTKITGALSSLEEQLTKLRGVDLDTIRYANDTARRSIDNKQAIIELAQLSPEISWNAIHINNKLVKYKEALHKLTKSCNKHRLNTEALAKLIEDPEKQINASDEDTYIERVYFDEWGALTVEVQVEVANPTSSIFEVVPISHWTNVTSDPVFVTYAGPSYVLHDSKYNCVRETVVHKLKVSCWR